MVLELFDATLRDGSYNVGFAIDESFVRRYMELADRSGVTHIEIGHGVGIEAERTGLKGSSLSLERWCDLAGSLIRRCHWGMFCQPSFTSERALTYLSAAGMDFVRIGIHPHQVASNLDYISMCMERFPIVYINLMKISAYSINEVSKAVAALPCGISGVYVVDSFGCMFPREVKEYTAEIAERHDTVGFHGHNNLGLANINSLLALEAGATLVDGTSAGVGRGAGNADLESLAAISERLGGVGYDLDILASLSSLTARWLSKPTTDRESDVLAGRFGIHSEQFQQLRTESDRNSESIYLTMKRVSTVSPVDSII